MNNKILEGIKFITTVIATVVFLSLIWIGIKFVLDAKVVIDLSDYVIGLVLSYLLSEKIYLTCIKRS